MGQAYEAILINEGISDLDNGRVKDGEDIEEEMKRVYGL